jgi:hypothetical protein
MVTVSQIGQKIQRRDITCPKSSHLTNKHKISDQIPSDLVPRFHCCGHIVSLKIHWCLVAQ